MKWLLCPVIRFLFGFPKRFIDEMPQKNRLDLHLLIKGLAQSRQQAQQLIRAGKVRDLFGQLLDKPGQEVSGDLEVVVKQLPRFVSRGGEKLLEAVNKFDLRIEGRVCIDCGISTGGFTDCLLQHGASHVFGVDVGYGQTAWKLRKNPCVTLLERTNIRTLLPEEIYEPQDLIPDLAVADLSFISLRLVIPAITNLVQPSNSEAVLLVKPQFEVGRERVGKKGVVKDVPSHVDALNGVINSAREYGWIPMGLSPSPITGPAGNHEYLLWLGGESPDEFPDIEELVLKTLL